MSTGHKNEARSFALFFRSVRCFEVLFELVFTLISVQTGLIFYDLKRKRTTSSQSTFMSFIADIFVCLFLLLKY